MKTILLPFLSLLLIGSSVFCQHSTAYEPILELNAPFFVNTQIKQKQVQNKSLYDTLYYQDFAGGIPQGWVVSNLGAPGKEWIWSNSAPGGQYSSNVQALNSTSGANGFMSLPSDFYNSPFSSSGPDSMNTWFTSPAISITPAQTVEIFWQQSNRFCCQVHSGISLEVSSDSVNWTSYDAKFGRNFNLMYPPYPYYDSVETATYDVSSVLANKNTAFIRFKQFGSSHYWWMIDDLLLVTQSGTVGLDEEQKDLEMSVSPNPNTGQFRLQAEQEILGIYQLKIRNTLGQIVLEKQIPAQNLDNYSIDLNTQEKGIYFLTLENGKERWVEKIVLQ